MATTAPRTTTTLHTALGFLRPINPEALIDDIIVKRDDSFLYGRLESALDDAVHWGRPDARCDWERDEVTYDASTPITDDDIEQIHDAISTITVADLFEAEGIRSDDDIEIVSETFDWQSYVTVL